MGGVARELRGAVVVGGQAEGRALVTSEPLSLWGGLDAASGEVIDQHHPLAGARVSGRVLVLPHGRGSCSASGVLLEAIVNGTAPAAIVTTRVDPIIGLGAILGEELYGRSLPVVVLTPEDAARIVDGELLRVTDGVVVRA